MNTINIAKRYARGLRLLVEDENLLTINKDYDLFVRLFKQRKNNIFYILNNPAFSLKDKKKVLQKILQNKIYIYNNILYNFIYLLIRNKRINLLHEIFQIFKNDMHIHFKIINIEVFSLRLIDKDFLDNIVRTLTNILKKKVNIKFIQHTSLLGGIQIKIGNYLLDDSMKTKLFNLKKKLIDINI